MNFVLQLYGMLRKLLIFIGKKKYL